MYEGTSLFSSIRGDFERERGIFPALFIEIDINYIFADYKNVLKQDAKYCKKIKRPTFIPTFFYK